LDDQTPEATPVLSAATAGAIVLRAAALSSAAMPLPAGLRAAAAEAESWQLARGLKSIATQLERGRSLEDCLLASNRRLPPHLAGLVRAAQRTGELGPMLAEWLENRRAARQHWRAVLAALTYPAIVIILAACVFLLFAIVLVEPFKRMFEEFGLKLPALTVHLFWICDVVSHLAPPCLAGIAIAAVGLRLIGGRAGCSWLLGNLPLVGLPWHWSGVAEMLRCLSLLVGHRVPLPEALRLTADGIADAYVARQCRALAQRVERGQSLTMSLINLRSLPLSIVPLVRWGEQGDLLSEGLRSAAEMIEGRLSLRTATLVQIVPPLVYVMILVFVGSGIGALFLPMIALIQGLS
jgi:type IV pilus assembly protein PilC